ncbi:hypothetical protein PAPYR_4004 [Paratrimastix pyriformis]|uniref:Uncharacterized protein n=1 Tax=Paratrimastix pyriformis TaxID=342808 RepID=A0ABQ8UN86_9EUKA|nr:hypothetical protein PAPYR_4004 [Paratrimastix pyriformis]
MTPRWSSAAPATAATCTTQNRDWHSCEICRQRYRVQFRSKPLLTWNRPRFEPDDIRRLFFLLPMLILGIFYICVYIPLVIVDLFSPREEGGEGTGTVQDIIWLGMVLCLALCWLVLILRSCGFIKNLFMKWRAEREDHPWAVPLHPHSDCQPTSPPAPENRNRAAFERPDVAAPLARLCASHPDLSADFIRTLSGLSRQNWDSIITRAT